MITKLYKKFIDKIIGEEQTPLHVFNCTTLVWISDIQSIQVMANEYKVYFDLSFCSGLQVRVLTYTDSRYSQHLGDIRKLFINAIGHSYLPLYESELKIGDSVIRLTEKKQMNNYGKEKTNASRLNQAGYPNTL